MGPPASTKGTMGESALSDTNLNEGGPLRTLVPAVSGRCSPAARGESPPSYIHEPMEVADDATSFGRAPISSCPGALHSHPHGGTRMPENQNQDRC